jgi:hypothetical protein
VNDIGDGNTIADCFYDAANDSMCFRAERQGGDANGRNYDATFDAVDECGNTAVYSRSVFVPHDEDSFDTTTCVQGTLKIGDQNGNASGGGKGKGSKQKRLRMRG